MTSALAARRLQRMQRSLFLSSCLLPLPLGLDRQKTRRVQVETQPQADEGLLPSPRIEFTFLLIFTGNLPSHAVRDAVASPKTSDEEFLVGPVDRRGITQSVNKALDEPSDVFQALTPRLS